MAMGARFTFKCTKCNYTVESSGDKDCGMFAVVQPYICNDCRVVIDVQIGEYGKVIPPEKLDEEQKKSYYRCYECNGINLTLWSSKCRKCPKCGGRMQQDSDGPCINWD